MTVWHVPCVVCYHDSDTCCVLPWQSEMSHVFTMTIWHMCINMTFWTCLVLCVTMVVWHLPWQPFTCIVLCVTLSVWHMLCAVCYHYNLRYALYRCYHDIWYMCCELPWYLTHVSCYVLQSDKCLFLCGTMLSVTVAVWHVPCGVFYSCNLTCAVLFITISVSHKPCAGG